MDRSIDRQTRIWAAVSAIAWIGMFAAKGSGYHFLGNCLGLVYHLSLAPVVFALPVVAWAKMAGYVWIFSDSTLDVAGINGMDEANIWALRMGVHISAAIWIIGLSLGFRTIPLIVGLMLGGSLGIYAIVAPFVSQTLFGLTVFPLMALWLGLIVFKRTEKSGTRIVWYENSLIGGTPFPRRPRSNTRLLPPFRTHVRCRVLGCPCPSQPYKAIVSRIPIQRSSGTSADGPGGDGDSGRAIPDRRDAAVCYATGAQKG